MLLELGVPGSWAAIACAAAAGLGAAQARGPWPSPRELRSLLWPAGAALGAFALGMAPLAGSGRSGVLGYVLNDDTSVHLAAVELLRESGTEPVGAGASSFHSVGSMLAGGYPVGSHAWPLFASRLSGVDAFHVWSPLIALAAALMALVAYGVLTEVGAGRRLAAVAGAVIASGYLPYSYLAQGGAREVVLALAVYTTIALFAIALRRADTPLGFVPAALGVAAAFHVLGPSAGAWLVPAAMGAFLVALWRPPPALGRVRASAALALGGVVALAAAAPALLPSAFVAGGGDPVEGPDAAGNLLGPVPALEAFNVWLGLDYRLPRPSDRGLTALGTLVSAGLTVLGAVVAARRGWTAVWLGVATGATALALVSWRYAISFEASALMALAPGLGLAAAVGVLWLQRRSPRIEGLGLMLGGGVAAGVLVSCALVYAGARVTPEERFEELASIDSRYAGRGPLLVNEREDYAKYLLRHVRPIQPAGRGPSLDAARTPDFDDYAGSFLTRFPLLLERRGPGGSRPPGNYDLVEEGAHYRVWRRTGPPPADRLALGSGTLGGAERLDCTSERVSAWLRSARGTGRRVRVAVAGPAPLVEAMGNWSVAAHPRPSPYPGFRWRRGGVAGAGVHVPRAGRYSFWIRGSFGPGVRLYVGDRPVGEVRGDLGLLDGWSPLGEAALRRGRVRLGLIGLDRPIWLTGSRREDLTGPLAMVPRQARSDPPRTYGSDDLGSLCGQRVDWMELV